MPTSPIRKRYGEVEARVKSFRETKPWRPAVTRSEKKMKPNISQPEYYAGGKRMNPTKLMYTIKEKVDNQIAESNGEKTKDESEQRGVTNNANFLRFGEDYLKGPRHPGDPLPEI